MTWLFYSYTNILRDLMEYLSLIIAYTYNKWCVSFDLFNEYPIFDF